MQSSWAVSTIESLHQIHNNTEMLSSQLALRLTLNSVSKVLSSTFATLSEAQATIDCESSTVAVQPFSAIPGPKPLPVIRNLLEFRKHFFTLDRYLEECSDKYGEIFKLEAPGTVHAWMHIGYYIVFSLLSSLRWKQFCLHCQSQCLEKRLESRRKISKKGCYPFTKLTVDTQQTKLSSSSSIQVRSSVILQAQS